MAAAAESGLSSTARRASASASCLAVLDHLDDRALGERVAGLGIERQRPLDRRPGLIDPADVEEHAGAIGPVARIARRFGHGVQRVQCACVVVRGHGIDRGLQPGRQTGRDGAAARQCSVRIGG